MILRLSSGLRSLAYVIDENTNNKLLNTKIVVIIHLRDQFKYLIDTPLISFDETIVTNEIVLFSKITISK